MATPEQTAEIEAMLREGIEAEEAEATHSQQPDTQPETAVTEDGQSNPWEWAGDTDPAKIRETYENTSAMQAKSHQRYREAKEFNAESDQIRAREEQVRNAMAAGNFQYAAQLLGTQAPNPPQMPPQRPEYNEELGYGEEGQPSAQDQRFNALEQRFNESEQRYNALALQNASTQQTAILRDQVPSSEFKNAKKLGIYDKVMDGMVDRLIRGEDGLYQGNMVRRAREELEEAENMLSTFQKDAISGYVKNKMEAGGNTSPTTAGPRQPVQTTRRKEEPVDFSQRNAPETAHARVAKMLAEGLSE